MADYMLVNSDREVCLMKISFVFSFFLLFGLATVVRADGVPDPKMDVSDPTCLEGSCTSLNSTVFSFTSNGNGGGFLTFQNNSKFDWTSLLIETGSDPFNVPANTVTCTTNAFKSCQVSDLAGGVTAMYFSGVNSVSSELGPFGILIGTVFTINLNDTGTATDGSGGWGAFRNFDAAANVPVPTPEPATMTLLGVGIVALVARRRFRVRLLGVSLTS